MENIKTITKNIRSFRLLKGIKTETMAKSLGISSGEYSKIENNYRKDINKYLDNISFILNIDVELLSKPIDLNNEILKLL